LVIPLIAPIAAGAGRLLGSQAVKKMASGIVSAKGTNLKFLQDYGKKGVTDIKKYKKFYNKVKTDPRGILERFKEDFSKGDIASFGEDGKVKFDFSNFSNPLDFDAGAPEKEEVGAKVPNEKFEGINGFANSIKSGKVIGSISAVLFIILFIVFAIRPVGSTKETRLSLMFKTILNITSIEGLADEEDLKEHENIFERYFDNVDDFVNSNVGSIAEKVSPQFQAGKTVVNIGKSILDGIGNLTEGMPKEYIQRDYTSNYNGSNLIIGNNPQAVYGGANYGEGWSLNGK
jgi:hypothetical protein